MRGVKHLILPVETAARELDAKLLLALHAVERGMVVTLGLKAFVNLSIHKMRRGILMPPNFMKTSEKMVRIANHLGHRVAAWDEEALVWLSEEIYRERRISPKSIRGLDMIMAWGNEHARALAPALEGVDVEVVLAGSPRADLLRPALRQHYAAKAAALRAEHGDFILINSNFGWLNHRLGHGVAADGTRDLDALAKESRLTLAYLEDRLAVFTKITEVLPEISRRFPDRRILVRPHPSEGEHWWQRAAEGLPNVLVRYDRELVPWLLAAGHIVHNSCTTAIEAALLDRVAISYNPVKATALEIKQPARVSIEATTPAELLELLAQPALTDSPSPQIQAALADMVASVTGPSSCERVTTALDGLFAQKAPRRTFKSLIEGWRVSIKRRRKHEESRGKADSARNPAYTAHMFPPTPVSEIRERTAAFAAALGMQPPKVRQLSDRLFRLKAG